jgi:hypothetical protein
MLLCAANAGLVAVLVISLAGCAPKPVTSNAPPAPVPAAAPATMAEVLDSCKCGGGEFRGTGTGKNENEAFAQACTDISSQIQSSITATSEYSKKQRMSEGKEKLESAYNIQVTQSTELLNAQDVKRRCLQRDGEIFGVVACMSVADAAKPYKQSQIRLQDSIELASLFGIKTAHPKQKNDARRQVNSLWARMLANQELMKSWGIEVDISKAKGFRDAAEDDYKDYCRTAKLHWKPGEENIYSNMAFSKLSQKLKIEKSPCDGRGISLVYRNAEPKCDFAGVYRCTFAPALLIAACDGTEYMLLRGPDIGSFHNNEEVSIENLQSKLREESFWNDWEDEILQWRPLCE